MPPKMQEDIQVSVARIEVLLGEHIKREENMWEKINDKIDKFIGESSNKFVEKEIYQLENEALRKDILLLKETVKDQSDEIESLKISRVRLIAYVTAGIFVASIIGWVISNGLNAASNYGIVPTVKKLSQ